MPTPECNPLLLLEQFRLQWYPTFDVKDKHIDILDAGGTWEVTYFTPFDKLDPNNIVLGSGFPTLIIDKAKCKIVDARVYQ